VPTIIRDLPYSDQETVVTVRGREYPVFSYQIVLWVSVTPQPVETFDPNTPRFPAVFDTGFTDNFLIGDDQLRQWAGLQPEHLTHVGHFRAHRERVPVHAANVWLHSNVPGKRDELADAPPFCLELYPGVGIAAAGMRASPRLPLLGLRGLDRSNLEVLMRHRRVTIRTPRRFWSF
jgi:hypothetical protein